MSGGVEGGEEMTEAQMTLLRDLIEGAKKKGGLSRCLEWLRFCPPEYREKMDRLFLDALEGAFRELSQAD